MDITRNNTLVVGAVLTLAGILGLIGLGLGAHGFVGLAGLISLGIGAAICIGEGVHLVRSRGESQSS